MDLGELAALVRQIYPDRNYPKPFDALLSLDEVRGGLAALASLKPHLRKRVASLQATVDPVVAALEVDTDALDSKQQQRARKAELMLGQLLLGTLAEQAFETIYRHKLGSTEFRLDDYRGSRNDTDYRVLNGGGKPLFRINSKLHGTRFRQAMEHVGLEPEDCFPLATYKIWSAREKEKTEHLPYLFLVISTPLAGEDVVHALPPAAKLMARFAHLSERVQGKRDVEERVVEYLLRMDGSQAQNLLAWRDQLAGSKWRVISAHRAEKLLKEKLFERVFALRRRGFNQAFRNAEIDMHFSLSVDMTSLDEVLDILGREGSQGIVGRAMTGAI